LETNILIKFKKSSQSDKGKAQAPINLNLPFGQMKIFKRFFGGKDCRFSSDWEKKRRAFLSI